MPDASEASVEEPRDAASSAAATAASASRSSACTGPSRADSASIRSTTTRSTVAATQSARRSPIPAGVTSEWRSAAGRPDAGLAGRERDRTPRRARPRRATPSPVTQRRLDRRLEPQLPGPRAVPREPAELGPGVAAQAAGGEQRRSRRGAPPRRRPRAAAGARRPEPSCAPPRAPCRGRPARTRRRPARAPAMRRSRAAGAPAPASRGGALRRIGAVHPYRRKIAEKTGSVESSWTLPATSTGGVVVLPWAAALRLARSNGSGPEHATDDDEPHAVLGHDRHPVAAGLDDLAPARGALPGQPAGRQVQPAAGIVDRPQRDELPVQVELRVGDGAGRLAGLDPGESGRCRPVDLAVAAGRRGAEPRRRDAPVGAVGGRRGCGAARDRR